jgi:hypothetical protein
MVRRRTGTRTEHLIPRWVLHFSDAEWPGSDEFTRWRSWQAEVRGFCTSQRLVDSDLPLWLKINANHAGVGVRLRRQQKADEIQLEGALE